MPLVKLILNNLQTQGKMPRMPKDTVKPTIVTGMEALGRGQDLNKLAQFLQYLQPLGTEVLQSEMNISDYIDRLGASLGIDTNGLIKSEEQKQAEAEQAQMMQQQQMQEQMMAEMASKATPEATKAIAQATQQQTEIQ